VPEKHGFLGTFCIMVKFGGNASEAAVLPLNYARKIDDLAHTFRRFGRLVDRLIPSGARSRRQRQANCRPARPWIVVPANNSKLVIGRGHLCGAYPAHVDDRNSGSISPAFCAISHNIRNRESFRGNAIIVPARLLCNGMAQSNRSPSCARYIKKLLTKVGAANLLWTGMQAISFREQQSCSELTGFPTGMERCCG
jgi:hypothetical protein